MENGQNLENVFDVLVELIQALNKLSKVGEDSIAIKSIEYLRVTLGMLV